MNRTVPEPCPVCKPSGSSHPPAGCISCQYTGETDWSGPAAAAEHAWLRARGLSVYDDAPEPCIGDNPPKEMRTGPGLVSGEIHT